MKFFNRSSLVEWHQAIRRTLDLWALARFRQSNFALCFFVVLLCNSNSPQAVFNQVAKSFELWISFAVSKSPHCLASGFSPANFTSDHTITFNEFAHGRHFTHRRSPLLMSMANASSNILLRHHLQGEYFHRASIQSRHFRTQSHHQSHRN